MGKILLKSIMSTSTQPKKYLKYKYKNTCCWGGGAKSKCINMYGNVVTIKFRLLVNFFSINVK